MKMTIVRAKHEVLTLFFHTRSYEGKINKINANLDNKYHYA